MDRNADYEWRDRIREKWSTDEDQQGFGNGNLASHLVWVNGESCWKTSKERQLMSWGDYESMYAVISSPNLLYRIACTFDVETAFFGESGYKAVWHINLKHKSGVRVGFGEHKGGSGFWTEFYAMEEGPHCENPPTQELLDDIKDLIDYFASDVCAHPYDGVVAGQVA